MPDISAAAIAAFKSLGLDYTPDDTPKGFAKSVPANYHQEYSQYMAGASEAVIRGAIERFNRLGWACYYSAPDDFLYVYEPQTAEEAYGPSKLP
jgi:hypothetical protein